MMHSLPHVPTPVALSPERSNLPGPAKRAFVSRCLLAVALAVGSFTWAGCKEKDTIRTYTVSKEATTADTAAGQAMQRPAVIAYEAPEGWEDIHHDEGMRFATLLVEEGDDQLEVSIIPLGGGAGGVVANVQRWRGQLGLGEATQEELAEQITEIQGRDGTPGLLIDMTGPGPEDSTLGPQRMLAAIFIQGGRSWFIKTMGNADFIGPYRDDFLKLCDSVHFEGGDARTSGGHASTGTTRTTGTPGTSTPDPHHAQPMTRLPDWQIPEGWEKEAEPRPFSIMSYVVRHGGDEAVMTVSPLSSAPQLLDNVNRWRGQLGLMPVEHLEDSSTPITISGEQGVMVVLEGEEQSTLGAIVPYEGVTWFFKLMGPSPVIAAEKSHFESFVQSIHFVEDQAGE